MDDQPADPGVESGVDATTLHVQRAIRGDSQSLTWLVGRLNPLLLAAARFRLGPLVRAVDPEDLVQDAWLVALPKLDSLVPRAGRLTPVLLRFLSTSILHHVRNRLRDEARRAHTVAAHSQLSHPQTGIVTRAVRRELHTEVHAALDRLTTEERDVILLRGVEQHSNNAVGATLGCSAEAVSKRYARGLARLRGMLPRSVFDDLPNA